MTIDPYGKTNARKALAAAHKTHGTVQSGLDSLWHWLNSVASSVAGFFTGTVVKGFKTALAMMEVTLDAYTEIQRRLFALYGWIDLHVIRYLLSVIMRQYWQAIAKLRATEKRIIRLVFVLTTSLWASTVRIVRNEKTARVKAIAESEADTKAWVKALHQAIEKEAASGYRISYNQRVGTIMRLLDFAVNRAPLIRRVADIAATAILDLVAVDNPAARWLIGFAIRHIVDRLGIDKAAGKLLADLTGPLVSNAKPRDLHDVIADLSARLVAAEGQWATFMADGGSQVEQAGQLWRDITGPAGSVAILAFMADAALDPIGWSKTVNDLVGRPANTVADATARLLRG